MRGQQRLAHRNDQPPALSVTPTRKLRDAYELVLTPPAQRAVANKRPEPVAAAVIEFLTTSLVANTHRVGKQLRDDLAGVWSARRGTYRALYRINDELREVVVLRVEHRRDAYRPL